MDKANNIICITPLVKNKCYLNWFRVDESHEQFQRDDKSLLAQFFYADEDLNVVANELDSFDGRKDPERCTTLVNQLRQAQDKVLTITNAIMDNLIGDERANRDFRVKFPEDVLQDNLAGQLWFGAEVCVRSFFFILIKPTYSSLIHKFKASYTLLTNKL